MVDAVPAPTIAGSRTTTSSSDIRITDKMNMHPTHFTPTDVSSPTQEANQDKPPSRSDVPTIQVGQDVTHIESNGT